MNFIPLKRSRKCTAVAKPAASTTWPHTRFGQVLTRSCLRLLSALWLRFPSLHTKREHTAVLHFCSEVSFKEVSPSSSRVAENGIELLIFHLPLTKCWNHSMCHHTWYRKGFSKSLAQLAAGHGCPLALAISSVIPHLLNVTIVFSHLWISSVYDSMWEVDRARNET